MYVHAGADNIHFVKLGYHEGLVDGDVWLRVQDRKAHQQKFPNNGKAMNSWLVGLMKCGNCGYAMHVNHSKSSTGKTCRYFYDYGKYTFTGCSHKGKVELRPDDVENAVLQAMREKVESLRIAKYECTVRRT